MALENYVKFLRGTSAAYNKLEQKDRDTLYFISENGASTGALYLGEVMIAGGELDTSDLKLGDLSDILIDNGLAANDILVYNGTKWASTPLSNILDIMKGASADNDGASGLVPMPTAGQENFFLRGDGTWADTGVGALNTEVSNLKTVVGSAAVKDGEGNVTTAATGLFAEVDKKADASALSALDTRVGTLETNINTLVGTDENKSVRTIATEVLTKALVADNASEAYDTLAEMTAWLQSHPENAATMETAIQKNADDIKTLNTTVGTLNGTVSTLSGKVSSLETTVNNLGDTYVTLTKFNKEVGDLTKLATTNEETGETVPTNVVDEILAIHEAMKWQDMK